MKFKIVSLTILLILSLSYCKKNETNNDNDAASNTTKSSLEQKSQHLKSTDGEEIIITYFALENEVAVRINKDSNEFVLKARGTDNSGNPIFSNESFAWVIGDNGIDGTLIDKNGSKTKFK